MASSEQPKPSRKGRQAAIAALRKRLDTRPDQNILWQVISAYNREEPTVQTHGRATALVLGSVLESGLETAILTHCIDIGEDEQKKLFYGGEDGPMNFAVKIRLGYGLGIYGPDSRDDLDIIRHVRNLFAHSKENMIFIGDTVIALCDEIKWINKFPWGGIAGLKPATPMKQYIQTVMHFFSYFTSLSQLPKAAPLRYADKGIIADVYS